MPSIPELIDPLADGDVVVRQAAEHDIPEVLIAYQDDPELHLRMGEERPPSGAELGRLSERALEDLASGRRMTLTIVRDASDLCLGQVNVHHVDWENARLDLGIWVAPRSRGQGLGRTALGLVARWFLGEVGFQRVQVLTATDNEPMLDAAKAAGFQYEGVLGQFLREQGVRVDVAVLSLVRRDLTG